MAINLEEQIKLLVELQGLDIRIFKFESELEAIPEKIRLDEENFKDNAIGLKKLEDGLKLLQVKRKEREGDLEVKESAVKKFQTQMYQSKTNKEYSAFLEEIARAKADGSLIEEDIIKILDQIDAENKKVAKEREFLKDEDKKLNEEKQALVKEAERIRKELDGIRSERTALAERIDKTILVRYERIAKNKDGLAIVPVANESCQGCFRVMPPQVINEIRMNSQLVFCENCARILYIEE